MTVHHELHGFESGRPVVVFLNGMTQSTAHWRSQARAFAERYAVVTYDARGQGATPVGDEALTLSLHADDLAALFDEVGVDEAHVVGFSHGARVALQFANSHPDRIRRLVLVSATASPDGLARTIVRSWREVLDIGGLEAMAWASLPAILGAEYLDQSERILAGIIKASVERNDAKGVRRLLDAMMEYPDLVDLARGVRADTLVISATEDLLVSRAGASELAELCGGEHHVIEGCGHTIPIERPQEFRAVVQQFLA